MNIRHVSFWLTLLLCLSGNGCRKPEATNSSAPPVEFSKDMVARVHWVGKRRLGVAAGAYYLMRIWNLPASKQLETQTLNKLASSRSFFAPGPATFNQQFSSILIRPLLNDALQEECYFAIRQPTNQPAEMVFAIRLNHAQDGFWETNLAILAQLLTGGVAVPAPGGRRGWTIKKHDSPNLIEATREGDWSLVGIAQNNNTLLEETVARARRYSDPFSFQPDTNYWLEAEVDLRRIADALSLNWKLPKNSPVVSLAVNGDGANVLTHCDLTFAGQLRLGSKPWNVPTNLIHEPLTSFTAVRGVESILASSDAWAGFSAFVGSSNPPPDQFYFWSQPGEPFESDFAAPLPDAGNRVRELTERLLSKGNQWLGSQGYVSFGRLPDAKGVTWGNLSMVKPFLTSGEADGNSFVFGGLLYNPNSDTNPLVRSALLRNLSTGTDRMYFDWEATGQRIEPWLDIGQVARSILRHPQMPIDSAAISWLGAVKPRLGESTTEILQVGTNRLSFNRSSTVGFTAIELHVLADWLESPEFPRGTHTLSTRLAEQPPAAGTP